MSVKLRWKEYKSGRSTAYIDIYSKGGTRKYIFTDIHIEKNTSATKKKDIKEKAEIYLATVRRERLNNKVGVDSDAMMNSSFVEYFEAYVKSYDKAGKRKYIAAFKKFKTFLTSKHGLKLSNAKLLFSQLTKKNLKKYKDYLYGPHSGLNGESPYDYFKRLKTVVKDAYDTTDLKANPASDIILEKPKPIVKKEILGDEEIKVLAKTKCTHSEVRKSFLFACLTGLGEKECNTLKWKNISNGRLIVGRAKNNEAINNKLTKAAIKLLGPKGNRDDYVFNLPSTTTVRKHLQRWVDKAGIDKKITFYCGRHTFAVRLLMKGVNLKTVADAMGHTSTSETIKYLNYVNILKDQAMDQIELDLQEES